ncbi:MAG: ribosome biogenesis GTPase Der, partial [Clostridia bacterium]|nr:ribosome biogenesis GTPase Der [Clostridia bacterium]
EQAEIAVDLADVIIFMVDGRQGLINDDYDVAEYLRKSKKPIVLAVNKIDNYDPAKVFEFYSLGLGEPIALSSEQGQGTGDVLDEVIAHFDVVEEEEEEEGRLKIAIVGKPNVGKSSLTNKILGYDRSIVSNISGTTRDAIDTKFEFGGKKYSIIDTAGIRRKRSIDDDVEHYSVLRSLMSIRKADVVLIVFDSSEEISEQDVRIAGYVHRMGKPSVIVMNKWDTIEKDTHTVNKYNKALSDSLAFMDYFIPVYVSAKTGQRVDKIIKTVDEVYANASFRPTTGVLNDVIRDAYAVNEPPSFKGRRLKIYFVSATDTNPPVIVFSVNDAELVHFSYRRYLENTLRKTFNFKGTPIKLVFSNKNED